MRYLFFRLAMTVLIGTIVQSGANAQTPPMEDMLLWLKADAGVITDATGVVSWEDQSTNGNDATRHVGTMQHTTSTFGVGVHDVIRFAKDGFFDLPTAPLSVPNLTVYAVVQQADPSFDDRIAYFSNYSNQINWGWGYHLDFQIAGGNPISRMFTSAGTQETHTDFTMAGPAPGMHLMTTQIDSTTAKTKSTYADGVLIGGPVPVPDLQYFSGPETASIGALGQLEIPSFYYSGDIAEIIVYSSVNETQRASVESYLNDKYFGLVSENADFDGDGDVDGADFLTWQRGLGLTGQSTNSTGDANASGVVDAADLTVWQTQFGGGSPIAAVPEPTASVVGAIAVIAVIARTRRRLPWGR